MSDGDRRYGQNKVRELYGKYQDGALLIAFYTR